MYRMEKILYDEASSGTRHWAPLHMDRHPPADILYKRGRGFAPGTKGLGIVLERTPYKINMFYDYIKCLVFSTP